MSFATIYMNRENFNWMKVHLRIPRFNRIFYYIPLLLLLLLSMNFYSTQVGFETHWFWWAKKNLPRHPPFKILSMSLSLHSDIKEGINNWAWESPNWPIRARAGYGYECSVHMVVINLAWQNMVILHQAPQLASISNFVYFTHEMTRT